MKTRITNWVVQTLVISQLLPAGKPQRLQNLHYSTGRITHYECKLLISIRKQLLFLTAINRLQLVFIQCGKNDRQTAKAYLQHKASESAGGQKPLYNFCILSPTLKVYAFKQQKTLSITLAKLISFWCALVTVPSLANAMGCMKLNRK